MWIIFTLVCWIIFGAITASIASNRGGDTGTWFVLGALFGPFALPFALMAGVPCEYCRRRKHPDARVCPHCQRGDTTAAENKKGGDDPRTAALIAALSADCQRKSPSDPRRES